MQSCTFQNCSEELRPGQSPGTTMTSAKLETYWLCHFEHLWRRTKLEGHRQLYVQARNDVTACVDKIRYDKIYLFGRNQVVE